METEFDPGQATVAAAAFVANPSQVTLDALGRALALEGTVSGMNVRFLGNARAKAEGYTPPLEVAWRVNDGGDGLLLRSQLAMLWTPRSRSLECAWRHLSRHTRDGQDKGYELKTYGKELAARPGKPAPSRFGDGRAPAWDQLNAAITGRWQGILPAARFLGAGGERHVEGDVHYFGWFCHDIGTFPCAPGALDVVALARRLREVRDVLAAAISDPQSPLRREWVAMHAGEKGPDLGAPKVESTKETIVTSVAQLKVHLEEKRAVVLVGPPGTGKTHLALEYVKSLNGGVMPPSFDAPPEEKAGAVKPEVVHEIVQMHPGYAYEDFVQGLRSKRDDPGFEFRDQIFVRMARAAGADPDKRPYVLILDEMNRCAPASVFGELIFLLERTDKGRTARLQYEGTLTIPDNLYLIGTMNSADRSIALVDFAIRRRFRFLKVPGTDEPLKTVYKNRPEFLNGPVTKAWKLIEAANSQLEDTHKLGPSFLMVDEGGDLALANNLVYEVFPQLREYERENVRGAKDAVAKFLAPFGAKEPTDEGKFAEHMAQWLQS